MKRTSFVVILVALSSSGCGTVCNLAGGVVHPDSEPRIYGGFIRDFEIIDKAVSKPEEHLLCPGGNANGQGAAYAMAAIIAVAAVDPVVCLVADTLTLPITIPLQNRRIAKQEHKSCDSQPQPPVANSLQPR